MSSNPFYIHENEVPKLSKRKRSEFFSRKPKFIPILNSKDEVIDVLEDLGLVEGAKYDRLVALLQKNKKYVLAAVGLLVVAFYALT